MEIKELPIESLTPYTKNARTHSPDQIAQVVASIKEFGWTNPVLIDGDRGIIAGHGRVLAAESMGMEKIPTIELSYLSEAQKRAYILADNQLALNAGWDQELLQYELNQIDEMGFDLKTIGFNGEELDELLGDKEPGGNTDEDAIPDEPVKAASIPGDIWICGNHVVICGDSTDPKTYKALMQDDTAQTIWTDPPYNVKYESVNRKSKDPITGDDIDEEAFQQFLIDVLTLIAANIDAGRGFYIAHNGALVVALRIAAAAAGLDVKQELIWVKSHFVLGRQDYQNQHESILYGWKPGKAHSWFGQYDKTTVIDSDEDISEYSKEQLLEILYELRDQSTVMRVAKPGRNLLHPTMKPIELITQMIRCTAQVGEIVLDPFGGSGSTMIACEKTRRHARLIELEPKFVDVIVHRWQDYTGQIATNENGDSFGVIDDARS